MIINSHKNTFNMKLLVLKNTSRRPIHKAHITQTIQSNKSKTQRAITIIKF
jgi:hypothetical protein